MQRRLHQSEFMNILDFNFENLKLTPSLQNNNLQIVPVSTKIPIFALEKH